MKLSIVVPVYNIEQYVEKCLNSILPQLNSETELVIVNDGSTDGSLDVVNTVLKEIDQQKIKVVSQRNKGLSGARNTGVEETKGEYLWFIDGDDYILPNAVNNIIYAIDTDAPELMLFNYKREGTNGITDCKIYDKGKISMSELIVNENAAFAWCRIYKRSSIGNHRFYEGLRNIEDFVFNTEISPRINTIHTYNWFGYVYNDTNMHSISRDRSLRHLIDLANYTYMAHSYLIRRYNTLSESNLKKAWCDRLNVGYAGMIFSLIRFYNWKFVRKGIAIYRELGVYPFKYTNKQRANLFIFVANHKIILAAFGLLYKYLKR